MSAVQYYTHLEINITQILHQVEEIMRALFLYCTKHKVHNLIDKLNVFFKFFYEKYNYLKNVILQLNKYHNSDYIKVFSRSDIWECIFLKKHFSVVQSNHCLLHMKQVCN